MARSPRQKRPRRTGRLGTQTLCRRQSVSAVPPQFRRGQSARPPALSSCHAPRCLSRPAARLTSTVSGSLVSALAGTFAVQRFPIVVWAGLRVKGWCSAHGSTGLHCHRGHPQGESNFHTYQPECCIKYSRNRNLRTYHPASFRVRLTPPLSSFKSTPLSCRRSASLVRYSSFPAASAGSNPAGRMFETQLRAESSVPCFGA